MKIQGQIEIKCSECSTPIADAADTCSTCMASVGAPNVRACSSIDNVAVLNGRYGNAKQNGELNGLSVLREHFEVEVENNSSVVVSFPSDVLLNFVKNPSTMYQNYESLVGSGSRKPALADDDKRRFGIGGTFFGHYAKKIIYGALSLSGQGLPSYGSLHCRLRDVAIRKRTTFLETNSYTFVEKNNVLAGASIPKGHACCWDDKHKLAIAKHFDITVINKVNSDFQDMLIFSDGKNRNKDEFIEAHIYGSFDVYAIATVEPTSNSTMDKSDTLNYRIILSSFNRLKGGRV